MTRLFALTALLIATAALTCSCESGGSDYDPYGVNSGGYYGSDLDSMNHNLLEPGSVGQ